VLEVALFFMAEAFAVGDQIERILTAELAVKKHAAMRRSLAEIRRQEAIGTNDSGSQINLRRVLQRC
jgi:hypothetical protein